MVFFANDTIFNDALRIEWTYQKNTNTNMDYPERKAAEVFCA